MTSASPPAGRLAGRVAVVTGAASGIGRAIAQAYAAEGARVVIADVTETVIEGGAPTAATIAAEGGHALFVATDVASPKAVETLMAETVARFGRIDVLVNNACVRHQRPLLELDLAAWNRLLAVNLTGAFLCCQSAVRRMVEQEPCGEARGRIVNLSSQHGMIAAPGDLGYGVTKAAVDYMTKQIAADYAAQGIVCNAVAPGKIVTGQGGHLQADHVLDRARRRTPWPRLGRVEDVAKAALFLASDEASFVTGATLMVDGGWMAA
ncbi:SDR family NAD(P)-dependent oxidoreductase [Methylopila henanensis]|uniref:SDR family NAD(P)-dependent oxidoreductase n=1 Tax=Methylopila henanensis TaxID=873516 RepID=A0ABW4K9S4_9HYPH